MTLIAKLHTNPIRFHPSLLKPQFSKPHLGRLLFRSLYRRNVLRGSYLGRSRGSRSLGRICRRGLLLGLLLSKDSLKASSLVRTATGLLFLQFRQSASLGVHLLHLSAASSVEVNDLLAGGGVGRLLEVRAQTKEEGVGALADTVALVSGFGSVRRVVLLVEVLEGAKEAVGDAVLVIELEGALDRSITDDVAVGEVLGQNARTGLLLLRDIVRVAVLISLIVSAVVVGIATGTGDRELVGTKLSVVQEKSGLLGSFLLKGNLGGLGLAFGSDLEIGDLSTMVIVRFGTTSG